MPVRPRTSSGRPVVIPGPHDDDFEDVHWALSAATTLWARGEGSEALKWLRRAASAAADRDADVRAVELFKAAADVAGVVDARRKAAAVSDQRVVQQSVGVIDDHAPRPQDPRNRVRAQRLDSSVPLVQRPAPNQIQRHIPGQTGPPPPVRPTRSHPGQPMHHPPQAGPLLHGASPRPVGGALPSPVATQRVPGQAGLPPTQPGSSGRVPAVPHAGVPRPHAGAVPPGRQAPGRQAPGHQAPGHQAPGRQAPARPPQPGSSGLLPAVPHAGLPPQGPSREGHVVARTAQQGQNPRHTQAGPPTHLSGTPMAPKRSASTEPRDLVPPVPPEPTLSERFPGLHYPLSENAEEDTFIRPETMLRRALLAIDPEYADRTDIDRLTPRDDDEDDEEDAEPFIPRRPALFDIRSEDEDTERVREVTRSAVPSDAEASDVDASDPDDDPSDETTRQRLGDLVAAADRQSAHSMRSAPAAPRASASTATASPGLATFRVAVLPIPEENDVRLLFLAPGSAAPPGVAVALLVPPSEEDSRLLSEIYDETDAKL